MPFATFFLAHLPAEDLWNAVCPALGTTHPSWHELSLLRALPWVSWNQLLCCAKLMLGNSSCMMKQIPPRLLHFQWFLTNLPSPCQVLMDTPPGGYGFIYSPKASVLCGSEREQSRQLEWILLVHPTWGHSRTTETRSKGSLCLISELPSRNSRECQGHSQDLGLSSGSHFPGTLVLNSKEPSWKSSETVLTAEQRSYDDSAQGHGCFRLGTPYWSPSTLWVNTFPSIEYSPGEPHEPSQKQPHSCSYRPGTRAEKELTVKLALRAISNL